MQRITKISNNDSELIGNVIDKVAQMGSSINNPIQDSQLEQNPQYEQVNNSKKEKASELVQEIFALSIDSEDMFNGMPENNQLRNMMGQIYDISLKALRIIDPINFPPPSSKVTKNIRDEFPGFIENTSATNLRDRYPEPR